MPLQRCPKDGKSGWQFGDEGTCYTGADARERAARQGRAIEASKSRQRNNMEIITFNFSGPVRHDRMGGREYIVAPMVMLTEGVHEGSNGPLYYPESELSKNPEVWNHKPIVLGHPTRNGRGVTACDPDIITGRGVGVVMNSRWDGKLRAEAWFEQDRMNKVDSRIEKHLEQNKMMEISTGLFTDNEDVQGEFNGKAYKAIARNHRPDHLALLPDGKGSCSIPDGGGLLQLNDESKFTSDELAMVIREKFGDEEWATGVCELIRNSEGKEKEMAKVKKEKIDSLIANKATKWVEDDRKLLETFEEDQLEKLEPVANAKTVGDALPGDPIELRFDASKYTPDQAKKWLTDNKYKVTELTQNAQHLICKCEPAPGSTSNESPKPTDDPKPPTFQEYVNNAPPEYRDVLVSGLNSYNKERQALIKTITDNEASDFTPEQLVAMSESQLQMIAKLAKKPEPEIRPYNFAGAAGPAPTGNADSQEPLLPPTWNFEKKAS